MCGVGLQIHVHGLGHDVSGEAWLDALPVEAKEYLHDEHVSAEATVVEARPKTVTVH
jgi:hypothetical protein